MTLGTGSARIAVFAASLVVAASAAAGQDLPQDLPTGIFVETPDGPQEVAVYADRTLTGRPRPAVGRLDDVQVVPGVIRLLCNMPMWRVRAMWLSTGRVLQDPRTERRVLQFRFRQLSYSTSFLEIVATEDPVELKKLLAGIGATDENPAYLFVTLESRGSIRDYIVGVPAPD